MFFLLQKHVLIATKWCVRYSFTSKVLSVYFKEQFYPIYTAHYPINLSTNISFPRQSILQILKQESVWTCVDLLRESCLVMLMLMLMLNSILTEHIWTAQVLFNFDINDNQALWTDTKFMGPVKSSNILAWILLPQARRGG